MQSVIDTIVNAWNFLVSFLTDWTDSCNALVADFFLNIFDAAVSVLTKFLDWLGSYCTYCTGGGILPNNGGSVSVFAGAVQDAVSSFSPCLLYLLNVSGVQGGLQILTCGMVIWSAFRVAALVRSVV